MPAGDAPEPEELIKAIQELENSASSDAIVREKIARLPPEVSEIGHLEKLQSAREGEQLMKKVHTKKLKISQKRFKVFLYLFPFRSRKRQNYSMITTIVYNRNSKTAKKSGK